MADTAHAVDVITPTHSDRMPYSTLAMIALTITSPAWRRVLHDVAGLLADLTAVVVAGVTIWKLWDMWRERKVDASGVAAASGAASKALGAAAKHSGRVALAALIIGGLAFVVSALSAKRADAAPAPNPPRIAARKRSADDAGEDSTESEPTTAAVDGPPWYKSMHADIGTHEIEGARHNPKIVAYFRDAGFATIKDDETAWCAAVVNAHLERNGIPGSKSLAARSFENWGKECAPQLGCVVVMWRGSRTGWQGHVGLYVRESATHVYVLGGNQGDALTIAAFPKSRVLSYRWPRTITESVTARAAAGSAASGATAEAIRNAGPALEESAKQSSGDGVINALQQLGTYWRTAAIVAGVLSVGLALYAAYRRYKDMQQRGV